MSDFFGLAFLWNVIIYSPDGPFKCTLLRWWTSIKEVPENQGIFVGDRGWDLMIQNDISLLREMLEDMKRAPPLYRPGNYWIYYIERIAREIEKGDLNYFRNVVSGPGSMSSFGGGRDLEGIKYGWHLYPFHPVFKGFDASPVVRWYNRFIDHLYEIHPCFGFLAFRGALARDYFQDTITALQDAAWMVAEAHDTRNLLHQIEDSREGNPVGFQRQGRFYTVRFLDEVMQVFFLQDNVDIGKVQTVLELGSGIGLKAATYLQMNRDLTYILVDIPPGLYVAQQYLSAMHEKILPYHRVKDELERGLDIHDYRAICIAPWMLDSLKDLHCDLFINVASFQEMEPWLVENYVSHIKRFRSDWVYLSELKEGHFLGKKGEHGLLKQTKYQDYLKFLGPEYQLVKEENLKGALSLSDASCNMLFKRG
jgi:putative sugar O-methyltransferase